MTIKIKKDASLFKIILSGILLIYSISLLVPLLWGIMTSFKIQANFRHSVFGWPKPFTLKNYSIALKNLFYDVQDPYNSNQLLRISFPLMFVYSFLYAGGCTIFSTTTACIVAYATVKYSKFRISKILYTIVIITMILPVIGNLPSEIRMSQILGFYNTFFGIWFMKMTFLGMYFLVFHSTFRGVANDYYEAAYLDGASEFSVMILIAFPLIKYTYFTILLLNFITFWNDYQIPLIYLPSYPTAAFGVYLFNNSNNAQLSTIPVRITGCIFLLIPVLILFMTFHKQLIGNVSMGGIKE